jgi:hypothetical protein
MTTTTNLGLSTWDTASGSATTFLSFRLALAGASSNMTILDTFAGATSASTTSLAGRVVTYVNASQISANYYEATVANITSYVTNSIISLQANASNTGAVTLKINSLAVVGLKKVDSTGTIVDLVSGDLILNQYYMCSYNGTNYVIMGSITSGSATSSGSVSLSGSNVFLSTNEFAASVGFSITTVTGSLTLNNTHNNVNVDATSGSITVYLPTASGLRREYTIKKIDSTANNVVIDASGSEVIDGSLTKTLSAQYASATIYADSANLKWWVK